jgi:hypothetical protein
MKSFWKIPVATVLFVLGSAMTVMAQIDNGMDFKTSFPFYAQNTKMPAGSYTIRQTDIDANELLIESTDHKYAAFVDFIPTQSDEPHKQSDVTFHKYGDVEYLNRIWVEGQQFGMKIDPVKAETVTAAAGAATEHSIVGKKH